MNREEYKNAFAQIPFSPDFQARTQALLRDRIRETEKENQMTRKSFGKLAVLTAAAIALLAVSVSAAVLWLTPAQVAEEIGDSVLAAAFKRENAVIINESQTAGDYTVTLLGLVSGGDLSDCEVIKDGEILADRTYAALMVKRTDGSALTELPEGLMVSPLAAGCPPWKVNAFTLDGSRTSFAENGAVYCLLETQNLEMFADRTVYLAVYEGFVPDTETFQMAEDGTISFTADYDGPQALFTLPLDPAGADPEAAEKFVEDTELGDWGSDAPASQITETDGRQMTAGMDNMETQLSGAAKAAAGLESES